MALAFVQVPKLAQADVLVELFTSQGCSACPSSDIFLGQLDEMPDVVPLSFHVEYWDYLGWKDTFANLSFSQRQIAYQASRQQKQVFTPQLIVNGRYSFSGGEFIDILASVNREKANKPIAMKAISSGSQIGLNFSKMARPRGKLDIFVAYVTPKATIEITKGENKGKLIEYTNVVRFLNKITSWDGKTALYTDIPTKAALKPIVIVQDKNLGAVLFAKELTK